MAVLMGSDRENLLLFAATLIVFTFAACAAPGDKESVSLVDQPDPEQAMAEGDYSAAVYLWTQQLNKTPDSGEIAFKLGNAYYAMGTSLVAGGGADGDPGSAFYDAAQYFRKALERGIEKAGVMYARALYMGGSVRPAHDLIQAYLEKHPREAEQLAFAGQVALTLFRQEQDQALIETARDQLRKALELDSGQDQAHLHLGDSYLVTGEPMAAVEFYLQGIAQRPGASTLHERLLATAQQGAGPHPDEVLSFYEQQLEKRSQETEPSEGRALGWWFKGCWHQLKGDRHYGVEEYDLGAKAYGAYIDCLRRSAAAWPAFAADAGLFAAAGRLSQGWCYLKLEEFDGAEEAFFEALPVYPEDPNMILAIDTLGYEISQKDGYDAALGFFNRLTSHHGTRHQWWNDYGFFSLETNMRSSAPPEKFNETYRIYERALELKPDYPRYVNDLAMLLDYYLDPEGKRKSEVESMYRQAYELGKEIYENPFSDDKEKATMFSAFTDALVNLTRFYMKEGRLDESRNTLKTLMGYAPDRYEAVLMTGVFETIDTEGIDTSAPDCYLTALLSLARSRLEAKSYRECLSALQELITVAPENEEVVAIAMALNAAFSENQPEGFEEKDDTSGAE